MSDDQREQARREAWEQGGAEAMYLLEDDDSLTPYSSIPAAYAGGFRAGARSVERDAPERVKALEALVLDIEGKHWFDMTQALRDRIAALVREADRG